MAALTAAHETSFSDGHLVRYPVAASTKIWQGGLVAMNASGYLTPLIHSTATLTFVGVAYETVDNTAGSAGAKHCRVMAAGVHEFNASSLTDADVGSAVYALDNNNIQVTTVNLTHVYVVGRLIQVPSATRGRVAIEPQGPTALALTVTGNTTIDGQQMRNLQHIVLGGTPSGSFALTMPAMNGKILFILNSSGQTATIQRASQSTPPTLANGKHGIYVCSGGNWLEIYEQA